MAFYLAASFDTRRSSSVNALSIFIQVRDETFSVVWVRICYEDCFAAGVDR
jgi:hypothetical protein